MSGASSRPDQYVLARRVLLDALQALEPHLHAITLVGAQAVYLQVGESDDLGVSPFTTDADLAIDPVELGLEPELIATMEAAGFMRQQDPGIWLSTRDGVTVDLLVPEQLGGPGRRAARLIGHGKNAAHKVSGLRGALIDRDTKTVAALEASDARQFGVAVAGVAALLVAKLYKIAERRGNPGREEAKDALDLFGLLRTFTAEEIARRFHLLLDSPAAQQEATQAQAYLADLFRDADAHGAQMVAQAVGMLADRDEIVASSVALAEDLLRDLGP